MNFGKPREPISRFTSVETSGLWRHGFAGQFSRIRGICALVLGDLVLGGGALAWSAAFPKAKVSLAGVMIAACVMFVLTTTAIWLVVRRYRVRFLIVQENLHLFTHLVMDKIVAAGCAASRSSVGLSTSVRQELLYSSVSAIAEAARRVLQAAVNDDTVKCSVRLATMNVDWDGAEHITYTIAGRSNGFDPNRIVTSIPADMGVPGYFLRESKQQGALICHDVMRAEAIGVLQRTSNDIHFPGDYRTFIVVPINGREAPDRAPMIGLLYVYSKRDPFGAQHVDIVRAVADVLGAAVPQLVELLAAPEARGAKGEC